MKPTIGIISNHTKNDTSLIYEDVIKAVELSGGEPLGLVSSIDDKIGDNILSSCNGFLFQGGIEIGDLQLEVLDYAHEHHKPILGICKGLEHIATKFFGIGSVVRIEHLDRPNPIEHFTPAENPEDRKKPTHKILLSSESILHPLFGDAIEVNSRHIKTVTTVNKPFIVSATSEDGLIEAIEFIDENHFILGVQFHPENLESMKPIFDLFISRCKKHQQ